MSLTDDNTTGGSASAPAPTPYIFLIFACVLQFLGLAIDLDMLDMFCSYRSLINMVCLFSMLSAIFCSLFSWIKSFGKLLIFPTRHTPQTPSQSHKAVYVEPLLTHQSAEGEDHDDDILQLGETKTPCSPRPAAKTKSGRR
jgi:hypothetical protein